MARSDYKKRFAGKYAVGALLILLEVLPIIIEGSGGSGAAFESPSAEDQSALLEVADSLKYLALTFSLMSVAATMLFWSLLGKPRKVDSRTEYIREPPYSYGPAIVAWLVKFGKAGLPDMVAAIMSLAHRKILDMKKLESAELRRPNFEFRRKPEAEIAATPHEKELLDYVFDMIAVSKSASLRDIQNYAENFPERIARFLKRWNKTMLQETKQYNFIEKPAHGWMALNFIMGSSTLVLGLFLLTISPFQAIPAILIGALQILSTLLMKRRTRIGETHYKKWMAFKRFIVDFSDIETAHPESMIIWEKYLIYAISLGVAHEVHRRMEILPFLETPNYGAYDFFSMFSEFELVDNEGARVL